MKHPADDLPPLRGVVACCVLAVVALSLGPTGEAAVRSAVRDAARPGFALAGGLHRASVTWDLRRWPWSEASAVAEAAAPTVDGANEVELRRLRVELAAARRDLAAYDASLGPIGQAAGDAASGRVERLPAQVLDTSDPAVGPGGLIVSAGAIQGVEKDRPAVVPFELAAGAELGIPADAAVLAGAAVIGKTGEVGAWTSTVVPVTSPDFRAHVRIVRSGGDGPTFGDEGLLEGDGDGGCVVKYVSSTSAVAAGDHVYSHDPSGRIRQPLYFGRIESADLRDGAPHWEIRVRPAADCRSVSAVHVLRMAGVETLRTASR